MYFIVKHNSKSDEIVTLNECMESLGLYELCIKVYPSSTIKLQKIKRNNMKHNKFNKSFSISKTTEECIRILVTKFTSNENDIRNNKNIYCPFHENPNTSKSKSAKFLINIGLFKCYSTACTVKQSWSHDLLNKLIQKE